MSNIKRTIDYHESDEEYLKEYIKRVGHLSDLVIEIMDKESQLLLSQVFRDIVSRSAHEVAEMHSTIYHHLCIDNPSKPLE